MTRPVQAVRAAVRAELADLTAGDLVLAAVSGGTDSLALAEALAFEAPRLDLRAGLVTVDHALHPASAAVAAAVVGWGREVGLDPCLTEVVAVGDAGGPEGAAREARHEALARVAQQHGAAAVLLAHHRDDQAEQVLLGLARGSGPRSLAGMPRRRGHLRRPLLDLPRATLLAALGREALWEDPANADPTLTRSRVRHEVMPLLERALGPGVGAALARTADLARADADLLDEQAGQALRRCTSADGSLSVPMLAALPGAVRSRVLRAATGRALTAAQTADLESLVSAWRGQGPVSLPGGGAARRDGVRIVISSVGGSAP